MFDALAVQVGADQITSQIDETRVAYSSPSFLTQRLVHGLSGDVSITTMIAALSKEAFVEAALDAIGQKVSKTQLISDIYETAHVSAGLPVTNGSDALRMFKRFFLKV